MDVGALVERSDYVVMRNALDLKVNPNHFENHNSWLRSAVRHMLHTTGAIPTKEPERKFLVQQTDAVFACIFNAIMHGEYDAEEKRALIGTTKRNKIPLLSLLTDRRYLFALGEYTKRYKGLNGVMETASSDGEFFYQRRDLGNQLRQMVGFMCAGVNAEIIYASDYRKFTRRLQIERDVFTDTTALRLPYKKS